MGVSGRYKVLLIGEPEPGDTDYKNKCKPNQRLLSSVSICDEEINEPVEEFAWPWQLQPVLAESLDQYPPRVLLFTCTAIVGCELQVNLGRVSGSVPPYPLKSSAHRSRS